MDIKKIIIKRKENEHIVILAESNCLKNGIYRNRIQTRKGTKEFKKYFKNINFCCPGLEECCEEEKYVDSHCFIKYNRITRSFSIGSFLIRNCPFCGKKFPKELGREWIDLIDELFGEEYFSEKYDELPEEFKTDEWWKKRGL